MTGSSTKDISSFYLAGINYKKTDATIRGQFAINHEQYAAITKAAPAFGISEFFILSTCNRTEIYGFAESAEQLARLLCTQTAGELATFRQICYIKNGLDALTHLFDVGAGLDSQILGDYEIVGQIKQAVRFSHERKFIGSSLERMVNSVLQSSKAVKNQTLLSGGTVSVSFAAIQYIRKTIRDIRNKQILVVGIGKIGRNTCKNIVDYLHTSQITLINRTTGKAAELASELGLRYAEFGELDAHIKRADIILVATNSPEPAILKQQLEGSGKKLVIDLSIPYNVEPSAQELPGITLVNVDELSQLKDKTLAKRIAEVPKARQIISEHISEYIEWHNMRKHVPVLKAVKIKLKELHSCALYQNYSSRSPNSFTTGNEDEKIQKIINSMALKMRHRNEGGCQYIQAINEFIGPGAN